MGSFRSTPELTKHTVVKQGEGLTYAVTNMCGKILTIQDGEFTWRMLISQFHLSRMGKIRFSQFLTGMEVFLKLSRG